MRAGKPDRVEQSDLRVLCDAREGEKVLVHRVAVFVIAGLAGERGAGLVEHAREQGLAAKADARAAGRTSIEVGSWESGVGSVWVAVMVFSEEEKRRLR